MAEIQMIQPRSQMSGTSRRTTESSGMDFSGMLREVGQTAPEKETANTVDEESGKNAEQSKVQDSDLEKSLVTDKEDTNTEKVPEEGTESVKESEINGLTGEAMAQLAGMLVTLSQNAQASQPQAEEASQQVLTEVGELLAEEGNTPLVLVDPAVEAEGKHEAQLLTVEDGEASEEQMQVQPSVQETVQPVEDGVGSQPLEGQTESQLSGKSSDHGEAKQSDVDSLNVQMNQAAQSAAETSGTVAAQAQPAEHAFSAETKNDAAVLKTSEDTLPMDLSKTVAEKMISRDSMGTLELTLEPATLGKITIKLMYEDGKASLSLISDNPKTLEILSQRAGEIAQILEEKTGQTTVVYTPESPYPEQDMTRQQKQEGHHQEQKEHSSKEHTESFAQQLRLGLI